MAKTVAAEMFAPYQRGDHDQISFRLRAPTADDDIPHGFPSSPFRGAASDSEARQVVNGSLLA